METPAPAAVKAATATVECATTTVEATTSTTVTAALSEGRIWREGKTCESSERDKGFKKIKSAHNLSFPAGGMALVTRSLWDEQSPFEWDSRL